MSSPVPMFGTQNLKDDDGPVIDSLFIETDSPPDLKQATEPIIVKELKDPIPTTRIISKEQIVINTWVEATLILPADANRKSLNLYVYSPTSVLTDGVRLSDENGTVLSAGRLLHSDNVELTGHTGAVYAIGCSLTGAASAPVAVEVWSVTI